MSLKKRLADDQTAAMKARESERLACVRMLRSKLQEREVELRGKHGAEREITDEEALEVVAAYAKQRRDSIESYRAGGRDELAAAEAAELAIVETYLPAQLGEDELRALVEAAVAATGASSPKDIGRVMQALMPKTKGRADGKLVSTLVKAALG